MILGRGTAQTDEEIIGEYHRFVRDQEYLRPNMHKRLLEAPAVMCRRIGKPIRAWKHDEVLALFENRQQSTRHGYNAFLVFLFFRGYYQPDLALLVALKTDMSRLWKPMVQPYRQKIEQIGRELCYYAEGTGRIDTTGCVLNLLLWLLSVTGKTLHDLTRTDFETFEADYQQWYRSRRKDGQPDIRLSRLDRYLVHWGIIVPKKVTLRQEEPFARLQHEAIRTAVSGYLQWCQAKYGPSTVYSTRTALLTFFVWLQETYSGVGKLDDVTREVVLSYAQYLTEQVAAGRYGKHYQHMLYRQVHQFFDFAIDERLDMAPLQNPFTSRDLPRRPETLPRYVSDRDLRMVLSYCEQEASLLEKTAVITLLHTGIRASELAHLKVSDIVQIAGVWKVHIHTGKGLKDRVIPLTEKCVATLQEWQEKGWERINEYLFTSHGRPWKRGQGVSTIIRNIGRKLGINNLTPHRFRHSFAVALLNYGLRESALQKLMGHATLNMTLEYARILDQTVEHSFERAVEQMQDGPHSWVPNFFVQEDYTLFVEGDSVNWIRLPMGYCRRNAKLHCESDVKCLLCDRFAIGKEDLPRLQQMYDRFMQLGLKMKADVVAAQIQRLGLPSSEAPSGFIPATAIPVARKHR